MINEHDINDWVHYQLDELEKQLSEDIALFESHSYSDLLKILRDHQSKVNTILRKAYPQKVCALLSTEFYNGVSK